jgi:hypothetical protein
VARSSAGSASYGAAGRDILQTKAARSTVVTADVKARAPRPLALARMKLKLANTVAPIANSRTMGERSTGRNGVMTSLL